MSKANNAGKSGHQSRTRRQPAGISIIHEDSSIIVVEKPAGLLTMGTERDKTRTVHTILNDYVRKGDPRSRNRIYIIHRLDRDTSGILVFAKSEQSKYFLQDHWQDADKSYLAVVHGSLSPKVGLISSYLAENSALSVYSTADSTQGKLSRTEYRVCKETKGFSLLEIHLLTGRKHQIRVHLSEKGHPIVGDSKYGRRGDPRTTLALHARSLSFTHPVTGKKMTFTTGVPNSIIRLIGSIELQPDRDVGGLLPLIPQKEHDDDTAILQTDDNPMPDCAHGASGSGLLRQQRVCKPVRTG